MSNPATRLADLLGQWDVPAGDTSKSVRGMEEEGDLEFWQGQARTVVMLLDIERALLGLEATGTGVAAWWEALPHWYRGVFAYHTQWQATAPAGGRQVMPHAYLQMLRGLGSLLDLAHASPVLSPEGIEEICAALEEVEDLIRAAALESAVRQYMLGLIMEARRCLADIDEFGTAAPRRIVFELSGMMHAQSTRLEEAGNSAEAASWRERAQRIVGAFFMAASAGSAGNIISELAKKAIE